MQYNSHSRVALSFLQGSLRQTEKEKGGGKRCTGWPYAAWPPVPRAASMRPSALPTVATRVTPTHRTPRMPNVSTPGPRPSTLDPRPSTAR
eukprot:1536875-Rhodomonas_salina.1